MATQHQQSSADTVHIDFTDLRAQTTAQRQLQDVADNSPQSRQLHSFKQMAQNSARSVQLKAMSAMMNAPTVQRVEEEETLQPKTKGETVQREAATNATESPKPNNTGLPDHLKSGIESLSGISMDHVKVHYNSLQPAQLNAHAYAQGSEIHVAPGQEQHLPHEAWHVVQQAQGRVQPTMQMKAGVSVNDDAGLEAEADVMGAKAATGEKMRELPLQFRRGADHIDADVMAKPIRAQTEKRASNFLSSDHASSALSTPRVVQAVFDVPGTFAEIVDAQIDYQKTAANLTHGFTTVGFEHEFAQFTGDNPLKGLTHVEVADSGLTLDFTGLPFHLETDADDALELVSPPFVVDTEEGGPTPKPEDVDKIDQAIKSDLALRVASETTLGKLADDFSGVSIDFTLKEASVEAANFTPLVDHQQLGVDKVAVDSLDKVKVKASKKGSASVKTISSQANIATDAATYDALQELATPEGIFPLFYSGLAAGVAANLIPRFPAASAPLRIFLREMSRQLAGLVSVPSIEYMQARGTELAVGDHKAKQVRNKLNESEKTVYETHRSLRSHVKDAGPAWLKDTLANFGLALLLTPGDWNTVHAAIPAIKGAMAGLYGAAKQGSFKKDQWAVVKDNLKKAKAHADNSLDDLLAAIAGNNWNVGPAAHALHGPNPRPGFGTHDRQWFGARQDTYIPGANVPSPLAFGGSRLHVVEARGEYAMDRLRDLKIVSTIRGGPALTDAEVAAATRPSQGLDDEAEDKGELQTRLLRVKEIRAKLALL